MVKYSDVLADNRGLSLLGWRSRGELNLLSLFLQANLSLLVDVCPTLLDGSGSWDNIVKSFLFFDCLLLDYVSRECSGHPLKVGLQVWLSNNTHSFFAVSS